MTTDELQNLLVAPGTGILSRMLDRIQNLNNRVGAVENDLPQRVHGSDFVEFQNIIGGELNDLKTTVASLANEIADVRTMLTSKLDDKPKRSRAKKEAPVEPDAPEKVREPEPAAEPVAEPEPVQGSVPMEYEGVPITTDLVLSQRNNFRVLKDKALILQLEPELNPAVLDFVLALTEEQVQEVVKRDPIVQ